MKKTLRTLLCLLVALALMAPMFAMAEGTGPTPGVTVTADASSPTGYTVTFVYEDADAGQVEVIGTFNFFKSGGKYGVLPEEPYTPFEYEPGMFRANNNDYPATVAMSKVEGTDYWMVAMPLPSGHYLYNYKVDGSDTYVSDPANPPMASTAERGHASALSTVNVPYDPVQGSSTDFDFLLPRTDGQVGQVVYADYTDINGNLAPLAIYLPYGYDAGREEGYKTLYLGHGAGGTEMEWFASGNTHYIFDNLIAEGKVEPTVIVTMCNSTYDWDFEVIKPNIMDYIVPFVEENYNVGTEPSDRAFAGLSMGGMTTTNIYAAHADQFGYIGVLSGCDPDVILDANDVGRLSMPTIMTGNGFYDPALEDALMAQLMQLGIPYEEYIVLGGHDWTTWPQLIRIFATNYLWK